MNNETGPAKYGDRLFGITTKDDDIIFVYADFLYFDDGVLLALRESDNKIKHLNLAMPPNTWKNAYAASLIDGRPVAIDYPEYENEEE